MIPSPDVSSGEDHEENDEPCVMGYGMVPPVSFDME